MVSPVRRCSWRGLYLVLARTAQEATPGSRAMTDDELIEWYECRRKARYGSFAEAEDVAWRVMRQVPKSLGGYQCEWCHGYHYGKFWIWPRKPGRPTRLRHARNLRDKWDAWGWGERSPHNGGPT